MTKILREYREEIAEFFKQRGERCLKITSLSPHEDGAREFICFVETHSGKKEKVFIRIQQNTSASQQAHAICAV